MKHHVLMATVPQRRKSLEQVLLCMAHQTRPPDSIHICCDGGNYLEIEEFAVKVCGPIVNAYPTVNRGHGRGVWIRWMPLHEFDTEDLVSVIDDDWFFDPSYLEHCRTKHDAVTSEIGVSPVIGWMGWITQWHMMGAQMNPSTSTPMGYLTGGLITGQAWRLRTGWSMAPEYAFESRIGDDLALAVGLSRAGIPRIRPSGWSRAVELPDHRSADALVSVYREDMLDGIRRIFNEFEVSAVY